ncbi:hypothetical protein DLP3_041 [Stenotrophomonas phage vB_SmaS_DLP_3]|nr:hypothetical protein DLP3_041 [Stenotrophomonas phage vB_SmaS_DLP_3]
MDQPIRDKIKKLVPASLTGADKKFAQDMIDKEATTAKAGYPLNITLAQMKHIEQLARGQRR